MVAAEKVIATAQAEVGYLEKATNAQLDDKTANAGLRNYTKYARDLDKTDVFNGMKQGFEWCCTFVTWCFVQTFGKALGQKLLCQPTRSMAAGVKYAADYFKNKGQFHTSNPKPGDQIFYYGVDKNGKVDKTKWAHTGIVEKVEGGMAYTIEGNTSGASGVISNGGGVANKSYSINYSRIAGYGRPDWSLAGDPNKKEDICTVDLKILKKGAKGDDVRAMQQLLIANGFNCGASGADGDFGNATDTAVRAYQLANGLAVDGACGGNTWGKLLGNG